MNISNFGAKLILGIVLAMTAGEVYAGTASLVFIQGIAGRDLAKTNDPQFPVDIKIIQNKMATCVVQSEQFTEIQGPYDIPSGTYTIVVSQGNAIIPCGNPALAQDTVTLKDTEFAAFVLQLSANTPVLMFYPFSTASVAPGTQQIVFLNTTNLPKIPVYESSADQPPVTAAFNVAQNKSKVSSISSYENITISVTTTDPFIAPVVDEGGSQSICIVAAIGLNNGSIRLVRKVLYSAS